ncbi:stalk domain-containing protein [Paenibacillus roseipurpureus]|uniref:Stalk domain-containing protein n=1 Tax=Paenibacillus roseopurpureus TaxID=2918901 RepID=A0AA96LSM0_9BACL|nr:stalk domain-containing protein [Paenibacillus sp. MBLB1832]WNR46516.1 stalk domain-containing protein [Paenibacillus sp. MBLB1832]
MKKMPKWSKVAIFGALMGTCFGAGVYAQDVLQRVDAYLRSDYKVVVNGQAIQLTNPPLIYNNSSYLPVKELAGYLGATVNWTESTKTIYVNARVNPNQPTEGNQTNYSEIVLQYPYAQFMDYRGATYPVLVNMADQTYYRLVDVQRMGIRTDGLRKAKEKYTEELYVSEAELRNVWGNEPPQMSYSNYEPLVVTGEKDPAKLKALKSFVDQFRYLKINDIVIMSNPIILDKLTEENTYSYLLTDNGHYYRTTIKLTPITNANSTLDYSVGSSSKVDIQSGK